MENSGDVKNLAIVTERFAFEENESRTIIVPQSMSLEGYVRK